MVDGIVWLKDRFFGTNEVKMYVERTKLNGLKRSGENDKETSSHNSLEQPTLGPTWLL